jgi:hypothetical protein
MLYDLPVRIIACPPKLEERRGKELNEILVAST